MKIFIYLVGLSGLIACGNTGQEVPDYSSWVKDPASYDVAQVSAYIHNQCYTCHSFSAPEKQGRVAPPMVAVKAHFLQTYPDRLDFVQHLTRFVLHPTPENSLMKGAVAKFGIMPSQVYKDTMIARVAAYIFDHRIEEPDWFAAHWKDMNGSAWSQSGKPVVNHNPLGLTLALNARQELGKNLMAELQNNGAEKALQFCEVHAMPITDSLSKLFGAEIRRVSDKPRNPVNKASEKDRAYLKKFEQDLINGVQSNGIKVEEGAFTRFYYPIVTQSQCLQCHGKPQDIKPGVRKLLNILYPKDLATGYGSNELRGMFSIRYPSNDE